MPKRVHRAIRGRKPEGREKRQNGTSPASNRKTKVILERVDFGSGTKRKVNPAGRKKDIWG